MADPIYCSTHHVLRCRHRTARAWLVSALLLAGVPADDAGARARGATTHGAPAAHFAGIHGRVYEDRNANGIQDVGEPGIAGVWIGVSADSGVAPGDSTSTDVAGDYALPRSTTATPPATLRLECVPAGGYFPVGACVRESLGVAVNGEAIEVNFRLAAFRRMTLTGRNVLCLGAGDLREKDWPGNVVSTAHGDLDLIAGGDATGVDPLSVWFNHYPGNPLFDSSRDHARPVPGAVLALAVDTLALRTGPLRARADVVTGTRHSPAGNFFTWITQSTPGNEGFLPPNYTQACRTQDDGDVRALATGDVAAGPGVDVLAGTRSPHGNRGTIELWTSDDAPTPTFAFAGRYPGADHAEALGEVTALVLARFGATGLDAVAGTARDDGGQLIVFGRDHTGPLLQVRWEQTLAGEAVRCIAIADVTGDGRPDLVVGVQTGPASGALELWRNDDAVGGATFTRERSLRLEGIPCAMVVADFGGLPGPDIAVGLRDTESGDRGRVAVFFCDAHTLPWRGSDPSAGRLTGWVPALVSGSFDAGEHPRMPASAPGFAAGVHTSTRTGELFVFIR